MKLIRNDINNNIEFKNNNTLLVHIELDEQIYEVIDIFSDINKEFIFENIKYYILKNNIWMFNIRNINIINEPQLFDSNENDEIVKNNKYS